MKRLYNRLKAAVSSGSVAEVKNLLARAAIDDIHGYFCEDLPEDDIVYCVSCDELFWTPLQQRNTSMIKLLLLRGAYPPAELCAPTKYRHGRGDKASTPLKRAVESGYVDDVIKFLPPATANVNMHPRLCAKFKGHLDVYKCTDCDTPLMAAVRRCDVTMVRLLIAQGANVSEEIPGISADVSCKTPLLVAAGTGDEEVITELVTSGADVNQSLGPRGTAIHHFCDNDKLANLLVRLGADPNAKDETGNSVFSKVLPRGYERDISQRHLDLVLQSLRILLPTTRDLNRYIRQRNVIVRLKTECTMLLLQHGARIDYSAEFLLKSPEYFSWAWGDRKQHSARFIELLRAADTDFSGVRQRIASVDRRRRKVLNVDVLEEKLSQPLTLQALCVSSVRRRLLSVRDVGMWSGIDALPLPTAIKDRLKLIVW